MLKVTFDPFDAQLGDAYGHYQALGGAERFMLYRREFSVDPQKWGAHEPPAWVFTLNWQEYRYADIQQRDELQKLIPQDDPGIYIFYARPHQIVYRFPQFAFYIGISNERGTNRPLRDRLKEYVPAALRTIRKRQNIHRMLQLYYAQIWVAFALAPRSSAVLKSVEAQLHGFVHPCFGRRDFPADIKQQQKAFGKI